MFQIPDRKILHFFDTRVASKQFIKFALVGTFNTLVDFTVYIFFTRVIIWPYLVAATLSLLVFYSIAIGLLGCKIKILSKNIASLFWWLLVVYY